LRGWKQKGQVRGTKGESGSNLGKGPRGRKLLSGTTAGEKIIGPKRSVGSISEKKKKFLKHPAFEEQHYKNTGDVNPKKEPSF